MSLITKSFKIFYFNKVYIYRKINFIEEELYNPIFTNIK